MRPYINPKLAICLLYAAREQRDELLEAAQALLDDLDGSDSIKRMDFHNSRSLLKRAITKAKS